MIAGPKDIVLKKAQGTMRVLCVGVSEYPNDTAFRKLRVCVNDAQQIGNAFKDIFQLNANKEGVITLTSSSASEHPTRGTIIHRLHQMAEDASINDRLLFYFSGHGVRIDQEFYFVPEDVSMAAEKETMLSLTNVLAILDKSDAKQKLLIVDACYSGPDTSLSKSPLSQASSKFLAEYLQDTEGTAILASSSAEDSSTAKSPDPKLSLFTYYLNRALRGDPNALRDGLLTVDSLYEYVSTEVSKRSKDFGKKQRPAYRSAGTGTLLLGDFRQSLLADVAADLGEAPIDMLSFIGYEIGLAQDVLTRLKKPWAHEISYIENLVNQQLGGAYEEKLGRLRSTVCKAFKFSYADVQVGEGTISFPGGRYAITYEAESVKEGQYVHSVEFDSDWFDRPAEMIEMLRVLDLHPLKIVLYLTKAIKPEVYIPGLESHEWEIESALETKIVASQRGLIVTIESDTISLKGFTPQQVLRTEKDHNSELVVGLFALLTS